MPRLKVVALISGGKDSLFSVLHCIENGHDVVALANLYPASTQSLKAEGAGSTISEVEDIDSYMYQTVGHSIVPLYEEALGLPLYRQQITGDAVDTANTYSSLKPKDGQTNDETESLVPLLLRVLEAHPEINAISSGAILSDYQRTRVETIAIRLGLTPLAYLWQFPYLPPQTRHSLLDDMTSVGQDARIIKVASGGLSEKHLWLNVADPSSVNTLTLDMSRFGDLENGSILGEGGEFETLAIDGPPPLWKKRIEIDQEDRSSLQSSGGAYRVLVKKARTCMKETITNEKLRPRRPPLLERAFETVAAYLSDYQLSAWKPPHQVQKLGEKLSRKTITEHVPLRMAMSEIGNIITISNVVTTRTCKNIGEEMNIIVSTIRANLSNKGLTPSNILHSTILLRSMDDFAAANEIYAMLFDASNPPSRVTVSCGDLLLANINVSVSVIINKNSVLWKEALHVQSQSYWAPANIGPYSQAQTLEHPVNSGDKIVFFAGQIPLNPATMELHCGTYVDQAVLSLQHLCRVARVTNVCYFAIGIGYFVAADRDEAKEKAKLVTSTWVHANKTGIISDDDEEGQESDDDGFDVGDNALRRPWATHQQFGARDPSKSLKTSIPLLPDRSHLEKGSEDIPPCFAFQEAELPRKAAIEWSSIGLRTSRQINLQWITDPVPAFHVQMGPSINFTAIPVTNFDESTCDAILERYGNGSICDIYTSAPVPEQILRDSKARVTPCRSIWMGEIELSAVFMSLCLV